MNLAKFSRRRYTEGQTPIEYVPNFTKALGGPEVYFKRDDLLGLTAGGNKTRKLEFLVADALDKGCDTLITCGAIQSNHCRLTLAAAVKEGMKCRLVLEERVAGTYDKHASGNNFLYHLLGVEDYKVVPANTDMMAAMEEVAEEVAKDGRKAYIIPGGGSNPIGATGYVSCAQEIQDQLCAKGLDMDKLVVSSGSTGTHAGLVTGFAGCNMNIPIYGINVSRDKDIQEKMVFDLVERTADHVGIKQGLDSSLINCFDEYWRPHYSLPNRRMVEAVNMLAKTEGILTDPIYTGKALAGLIDLSRKGIIKKGEKVLFVHTGGSPALYAYIPVILGDEKVEDE